MKVICTLLRVLSHAQIKLYVVIVRPDVLIAQEGLATWDIFFRRTAPLTGI